MSLAAVAQEDRLLGLKLALELGAGLVQGLVSLQQLCKKCMRACHMSGPPYYSCTAL